MGKVISLCLSFSLGILCVLPSNFASAAEAIGLTILHTNDLHSYFWGNGPDASFTATPDGDPVQGHYARLAQALEEERNHWKTSAATVTFDAGDWFGGTIFHALAARPDNSVVPELFFFAKTNYDVSTLGNHEFDAGEKGLATMLRKYKASEFGNHPFQLVVSNNRHWGAHLAPFVQDGTIKTSQIRTIEFQGQKLKLGILGALGPDAALVSATRRRECSFFGFDEADVKVNIPELVAQLRFEAKKLKEQGAQALVLIIHAGSPEDTEIAQQMPELDVIIAGHTHELYLAPKVVGKTIIAQAGEYGKNLGILPLKWRGDHFELQSRPHYHRPINDAVAAHPDILSWTQSLWDELAQHCRKHGADCREQIYLLGKSHYKIRGSDDGLGRELTSILRRQLSQVWKTEVDLYFTSFSMVRSGLIADERHLPTAQLFSDVFRIFPLGIDEETLELGYKTSLMYLSKREVRLLINFMEIYRNISKNFVPSFSDDLMYEVRWWGIPMFNRLKGLSWRGKSYDEWPERMALASNEYVASYLDKVEKMTYGLVKFHPTDRDGKPIQKSILTGPPEFEILTQGLRALKQLPAPAPVGSAPVP